MFHWICPECGREIAPTVRECAVCDPVAATVGIALAGEVEAPARATKEGALAVLSSTAVGIVEERREARPEAWVNGFAAIEPHLAMPSLAARVPSLTPVAAPIPQGIAEPDVTETSLPQFGAGDRDPLDHLSAMLDSLEPEPPPSGEIIAMSAPAVPPALRAFIAELRPVGALPRIPVTPPQTRQSAPEPPVLTIPIRLALKSSRQPAAQPAGAKLLALPAQAAGVIQPRTPQWEPAPAMAPLGEYNPLAGRPLRPAVPQIQVLKKECAPRTTLPGPMLTRRLVKFMDRELTSIPPQVMRVKKRLIPGWMVTALILGTLLGAGFTSVISVVRPAADGKPVAAAIETPAAVPVIQSAASPLAKAIEVTGFRIQMEPGKKSEIQYLVVNHTATRFTGVTVLVTLYAADAKAGQPPLCKFQFAAPNLGPYQAKDMTSAIEQVTRPVTLPEWQELRAVVEIAQ